MKKVFYIGYYVEEKYEDYFNFNVPGRLKMKYVLEKLYSIGCDVRCVSLCSKKKKCRVKKEDSIKYFASFGSSNKYIKYFNLLLIKIQLLLFVLFFIKKNDTVILYHSYIFTHFLNFIRKIKKINVILEVEEVYGYSAEGHRSYLQKELKDIKQFDKAIFVNDFLPKELDFLKKSYVVSYGVCNFAVDIAVDKFNDGKIHAIYAGTIENKKLGAFSAIKAAEYLTNDFVVDIFGFGSKKNLEIMNQLIDEVNSKTKFEVVRYMGYRNSSELSKIMLKYDIGLSTNIMEKDFANNTFPSKIITYMSHGLSIVSGYAEAFEGIDIAENWSFFYEYNPKAIANAILNYKSCSLVENQKKLKIVDDNLIQWLKENI